MNIKAFANTWLFNVKTESHTENIIYNVDIIFVVEQNKRMQKKKIMIGRNVTGT